MDVPILRHIHQRTPLTWYLTALHWFLNNAERCQYIALEKWIGNLAGKLLNLIKPEFPHLLFGKVIVLVHSTVVRLNDKFQ